MKHLAKPFAVPPAISSVRRWRIGLGLLLFGLVVFSIYFTRQTAEAQCGTSTSSCKNCHEVQGQDPVGDKGEWHTAHAFGDFCEFCHAGTVDAKTQDEAHAGLVDPMVDVQASCQSCHPQDYKDKALVYASALGIQLSDGGSGGSGGPAAGAGGDSGAAPSGGSTAASTASDSGSASATNAASSDAANSTASTDMGAAPTGDIVDFNLLYAESIAPEKTLTTGDWILVGLIAFLLVAFVVAIWKLEHWGDRLLHWWQTNVLPPNTMAYGNTGMSAGTAALVPMPSLGDMASTPKKQPSAAGVAAVGAAVAAAPVTAPAPAELEDLYRRRPELRLVAPYLLAADDKTLQALALVLRQPGAREAILRLSQLDLSLLAALQDLPPADQALLLALAQKR